MRSARPSPSRLPAERQRWAYVDRLRAEHPPLDLAAADFTVLRPEIVVERFGNVLGYMARTELEVERNVLELATLLPDPPPIDRFFYADVWGPQEARHGLILDELQVRLGSPAAEADLTTVSMKLRVVGALAHLPPVQDVVRMLYYLTGMTTERSALLAYHRLEAGLAELGETALVETVVSPIRRQEPGHHAYYQMAARSLWHELSTWQRWLVRHLRSLTFTPVGAGTADQKADVGDMMTALGMASAAEAAELAEQVSRVERDMLWAREGGMRVPAYVARAFTEAVDLAAARAGGSTARR